MGITMINPKVKSEIVNVVCTASLIQKVDVTKFSEFKNCIYDKAIYGGRCGYVKLPEMKKSRVTVFPSGKMISIGAKSTKDAQKYISIAKSFLLKAGLIEKNAVQKIQIRNIVARIDTGSRIPIEAISSNMTGAMYDPSSFSGMMIHGNGRCHFIIFANGKIMITGAKSVPELNTALFDMITRINSVKIPTKPALK